MNDHALLLQADQRGDRRSLKHLPEIYQSDIRRSRKPRSRD